jgi:fimbrial isopeptide formation D2 family protein/LPXTG-motif cell wall-anchored protein
VTGSIKPKDEDRSDEEIVSAVILDNAAPTATVNPKASVPELNKEIKKVQEGTTEVSGAVLDEDGKAAVAKVGSTVSYEITATTPDLTGYTDYIYKATDTISAGLAYVKDSFELKIDGAAVDIDPVFSNSDKTFTLTIPYNTMKNYAAGKNVVITYNCTVTADSLSYDYAKNTAKLEYSHNPFDEDDTDTTPDSETYVLNINLDVDKVAESASGEKLTGAKFKLRKSATEYYKWDETNGKVTWVAEGQADVFETENGALKQQVRGLDKGTYYLVETEAPTGYNLLKDPITVEISVSEGNDKKVTYTATAGGQTAAVTNGVVDLTAAQNANQPVATATIINNSGAELPSTGGIGTTIFYVIGAILVLGAGVLLVTRRRMNAN